MPVLTDISFTNLENILSEAMKKENKGKWSFGVDMKHDKAHATGYGQRFFIKYRKYVRNILENRSFANQLSSSIEKQ